MLGPDLGADLDIGAFHRRLIGSSGGDLVPGLHAVAGRLVGRGRGLGVEGDREGVGAAGRQRPAPAARAGLGEVAQSSTPSLAGSSGVKKALAVAQIGRVVHIAQADGGDGLRAGVFQPDPEHRGAADRDGAAQAMDPAIYSETGRHHAQRSWCIRRTDRSAAAGPACTSAQFSSPARRDGPEAHLLPRNGRRAPVACRSHRAVRRPGWTSARYLGRGLPAICSCCG